MLDNSVWVISYCNPTWAEPIVTVYDNEEAARAHYNYLKSKLHNKKLDYKKFNYAIAIDKCPVYRTFKFIKKGE